GRRGGAGSAGRARPPPPRADRAAPRRAARRPPRSRGRARGAAAARRGRTPPDRRARCAAPWGGNLPGPRAVADDAADPGPPAEGERVRGHVARDERARADDGVRADRDPAQDGHVGGDPGVVADAHRLAALGPRGVEVVLVAVEDAAPGADPGAAPEQDVAL